MSETFAEQVERVMLMTTGNGDWDLSDNDIAALRAVLDALASARSEVARLTVERDAWIISAEHAGRELGASRREITQQNGIINALHARTEVEALRALVAVMQEITPASCGGYGDFAPSGGWDAWEERYERALKERP